MNTVKPEPILKYVFLIAALIVTIIMFDKANSIQSTGLGTVAVGCIIAFAIMYSSDARQSKKE